MRRGWISWRIRVGGGGEFFCGVEEHQVVLQSLNTHGVDEYGLGGGRDDWFRPGDGVGGDGAIDEVVRG